MSDEQEYIESLETENENLRKALSSVAKQLEENWSDSLTIGLVPMLHYIEVCPYFSFRCKPKKWKSLRLVREYILSQLSDGKIVNLKLFDAGDNRTKIYREVTISDSDGNPITEYILESFITDKA